MYGTGMNPYTLRHFQRVARNMNNYVAGPSYNYYPRHDGNLMGAYQASYYQNTGYADMFANRLYSMGLPYGMVDLGYSFGQFIDVYA
jgi:hypothetical protein